MKADSIKCADATGLFAEAERTSLWQKFPDLIACPSEVFSEIAASPSDPANWRVPLLLVCLANVLFAGFPPGASNISRIDPPAYSTSIQLVTALTAMSLACAGTFWAAFILWLIGKTILRRPVGFNKALEVVGLTNLIAVLGVIVTALLVAGCDDPAARPSLSLFLPKAHAPDHLRAVLDSLNAFQIWTAALLSVGLSKLSRVALKECAFWVFGYWIVLGIVIRAVGA
jgi:hypothetical protein